MENYEDAPSMGHLVHDTPTIKGNIDRRGRDTVKEQVYEQVGELNGVRSGFRS